MRRMEGRKEESATLKRTNASFFLPLFSLHLPLNNTQVDAAVGLATKLYSSSAEELSDQVSGRGGARVGGRRAGRGERREEREEKKQVKRR